ncbi:MAG: tripartite tricarboxylate transporter substrate binding protein [Betaproteobacteria bacterium]|nr:tripartite tricarboxylate transporter substrate binding protein [Betaproteobacteria bacterium]
MIRRILRCLLLALWAQSSFGQEYPLKTAKIVVGFGAGGPTDVIARIVAQDLSASLGQGFVVENRAGANAIIATEYVARSAPDGYTLLFSSLSLLVNSILMQDKVKYDPFRDFAPISNAALLPMVVVTSPETRITTLPELVALAKAKSGEVSYGTSGHAGSTHLAGAMLENFTTTKMINVPFKGNGPALAEVMSGRVTFMFYPIIGIADQVAAKRLKVIAVGTAARHADFPGVPTMAELGFPGFEATAPWVGMLAPAGTPLAIVNKLSVEMRKSLAKPETQARMKQLGAIVVADNPAEYAAFLKKDYERWAEVIKASGVKAE